MKKIILIASDPNSINTEIIYKTWKKISTKEKKLIYVIGNIDLINKQFKRMKVNLPILKVDRLNHNNISNKLKVINIPLRFKDPFNVSLINSNLYNKALPLSSFSEISQTAFQFPMSLQPVSKLKTTPD